MGRGLNSRGNIVRLFRVDLLHTVSNEVEEGYSRRPISLSTRPTGMELLTPRKRTGQQCPDCGMIDPVSEVDSMFDYQCRWLTVLGWCPYGFSNGMGEETVRGQQFSPDRFKEM